MKGGRFGGHGVDIKVSAKIRVFFSGTLSKADTRSTAFLPRDAMHPRY